MSNEYAPKRRTNVSANYNVDINEFVSLYLKQAQDRSSKATSETTIGAMIVNTLVHFVIGPGLEAQASPEVSVLGWDSDTTQKFISQAEAFFRMNAGSKEIDYYHKENFQTLQAIAFRNILTKGDMLLHRTYKGKKQGYAPCVQALSGSWVRQPSGMSDTKRITGGVEFDEKGHEIAYHIVKTLQNRNDSFTSERFSKYNSTTGFEEFDLIRINPREANQVRGIPLLTPALEDIYDLETFKAAYRTKAATQALLTAVIESKPDAPAGGPISTIDTIKALGRETPEALPYKEDESISLGTGNIIALAPGEEMNMVESKVPATDYNQYVRSELQHIGGAVGLPYEMMVQTYSSNYSASRATIAGAEKIFRDYREEFASKFCAPVWQQVVDYGIRVGAIEAPGYIEGKKFYRDAVLASTWIGPSPISIDPLKEVNAHITAINANLETRERAMREMYQTDFEETIERIAKEQELLMEKLGEGSEFATTQEEDTDENLGSSAQRFGENDTDEE